ncbi:MAG: hypothetical protein Q8M39_00060 [Sulfuricurvum sp.]|nr:hypothetical protein [Sulfuricurvum sp.]
MKKVIVASLILAGALMTSGCTHRLGQFTAASSKTIENFHYKADTKSYIEGEECNKIYVIIPTGSSDDMIQRAMDNTLEKGRKQGLKGNMLIDVRLDSHAWYIPYIYGESCVTVKGYLVEMENNQPLSLH